MLKQFRVSRDICANLLFQAITTTTDHSQQPTAVLDKRDGLLLENKKGGGGGRGGGGGAGGGHSGAVAQLNNAHAFAALPLLALAVLI